MRPHLFTQLCAVATRECGDAATAQDVVQDALVAAVQAGRADLRDAHNARWLRGVVRNKARMSRRGAQRSRLRDHEWQGSRAELVEPTPPPSGIVAGLPPSLKVVAALVLTGHDRAEIAYLLQLSDAALRQRVVALKKKLRAAGVDMPEELTGLDLDLDYGQIRDALLPQLLRHGGAFASHDPDGHFFVVRRSQEV